jgi:hypothetical protein
MAMAPANYSGLANLMNLQGVGVNPTSQLAYVPSKDLMTRYQTIPNPRTGIPQAMGVTGMAEGGMPSQQYPMQEEAMELANRGRYGDTTLVHMTPGEVQGLASLGQLTINPDTGLPEAFNMKSLLPIIGGIAGSFLLPGAGTALGSGLGATAIGAGLGTTAGGLLAGQKPGDALLSGILSGGMSYVGGLALGAEGLTPLTAGGGEIVTTAGGLDPTAAAMAAGQGPTGAATVGQAMQAIDPTAAAMNVGDFGKLVTPETQLISKTVPTFEGYSVPAREPNLIQRALGIDAEPAKIIPKSDLMGEVASRQLTDPLTYAPLGVAALTGAFDDPYEYKEPARPPKDSGFGDYSLVGGEERNPETAKEIQSRMLAGGVRPSYFSPTQRYVRNDAPNETSSIKRNVFDSDKFKNVAEGGIVGLQQGGMPTPQAPSAMAGMLAQPQPQQPVMPQQPQPSMPMSPQQMGSGIAPLPDQQKEFMRLMDMEDQLQSQKRSQSTQALASLIGLGTNFAGSQYPQTSPSGQAVQPPPTPPMNYGSQVNLGLAGGGQPYFEGQVQGPGDGQSDEVAFRVDGGQVDGAMLSPQEYVLAADVVSAIGNGSSDAGAAKLDQFMKGVRQDAYGTTKQMQPFNNQGLTNLVA